MQIKTSYLFLICCCASLFYKGAFALDDENLSIYSCSMCLGDSSLTTTNATENDYKILAGGIGETHLEGTWGSNDEGAILMLNVVEVNEEDGQGNIKICPVQIQSSNKDNRQANWITLFSIGGRCATLYKGNTDDTNCDLSDYETYWEDEKLKTSGGYAGRHTSFYGLKEYSGTQKNWKDASFGPYAVKKLLPHGIVLTAYEITTASFKGDGNNGCENGKVCSYIKQITLYSGGETVFCAQGYTEVNGDCQPIDSSKCPYKIENIDFCSGYSAQTYYSNKQELQLARLSGQSCSIYYCRDSKQGFASDSDHTCVECPKRSGRSITEYNGQCAPACPSGKFWESSGEIGNSNYKEECVDKYPYSKLEMQYGKGVTKKTNTPCWKSSTKDDYIRCVKNEP